MRIGYQFSFLGLFTFFFFLLWYKGLLKIDHTMHYLLIASLLMYIASYLVMLKLFIPVRQLEFTMPIWALLVQSLMISKGITLLRVSIVRTAIKVILLTCALLICAVMVRTSILPSHFKKRELVDVTEYETLYDALGHLPSDGIIASHPSLADPIPTMTGRRVLFNTAMANPIFKNYWSRIKLRAISFTNAYYSEDKNDLIEFCTAFDVEYLIVRTSDFSNKYLSSKHGVWEPYRTWERNASAGKSDFALLRIPDECKLYIDSGLFVVSASMLKSDCIY